MFTSTSKRTGSDDNHAIDRDGSAGDEGDKILTAGPSAWESTSTNLVRNVTRKEPVLSVFDNHAVLGLMIIKWGSDLTWTL